MSAVGRQSKTSMESWFPASANDISNANNCQGLGDSEMNGVCTLLKMRESGTRVNFSHASTWVEKKRESKENNIEVVEKNSSGVLVPENGIEKLAAIVFEPAELLSQVKKTAEVIAMNSVLELQILKAQLSAFYMCRGGYKMPNYHEPQPVSGFEDNTIDESLDKANRKETTFQGPSDEDFSLPLSRLHHRRKHKSIAQIIREDNDLLAKESPPCIDQNVPNSGNGGCGGKQFTDEGPLARLKRKKNDLGDGSAMKKVESDGSPVIREGNLNKKEGKEQSEKGFLSRERKKSKYLSPPFTIPSRGQKKSNREVTSDKDSSKALTSETISKEIAKEPSKDYGLTDKLDFQSPEEKNETIDLNKIQASPGEVISEVRFAALNPQVPKDVNFSDKIMDFVYVFRSSMYRQGSMFTLCNKSQPGRKRKKPESEHETFLRKSQKVSDQTPPNHDSEVGHHKVGSKQGEHGGKSKTKASSAKKKERTTGKPSASPSSINSVSNLNFIKHELEAMSKMLEGTEGLLSDMLKKRLESDIKGLLVNVKKMAESFLT